MAFMFFPRVNVNATEIHSWLQIQWQAQEYLRKYTGTHTNKMYFRKPEKTAEVQIRMTLIC